MIMCFMLLFCLSSAHALSMVSDQDSNLEDYRKTFKGNTHIYNSVGSIDDILINVSGNVYYYDYSLEFSNLQEDFFVVLQNNFEGSNVTVYWRGDLTKDDTLYIQNLTLNEVGRYFIKFEPEYPDEVGRVYINFVEPSYVGTHEIVEEKPRTFNALVIGLMDYFEEIAQVNVDLWVFLFWTIVFLVGIGLVGMLFGIAFWLFAKAKELKKKNNWGDE